MGVIAEISTRVKKEFYGYRKEKQLMFNFMDCFFLWRQVVPMVIMGSTAIGSAFVTSHIFVTRHTAVYVSEISAFW